MEGIATRHVDVLPGERGEAGHVLVADLEAVRPEPVHRGVHVPRVEQHAGMEDQAQGAELVLHAVLVALVELPGAAVEALPSEGVTALLEVRLALDLPPVAGLVSQAQDVRGLGDPPVVGDGVAEWGGVPVAGQHEELRAGRSLPLKR